MSSSAVPLSSLYHPSFLFLYFPRKKRANRKWTWRSKMERQKIELIIPAVNFDAVNDVTDLFVYFRVTFVIFVSSSPHLPVFTALRRWSCSWFKAVLFCILFIISSLFHLHFFFCAIFVPPLPYFPLFLREGNSQYHVCPV